MGKMNKLAILTEGDSSPLTKKDLLKVSIGEFNNAAHFSDFVKHNKILNKYTDSKETIKFLMPFKDMSDIGYFLTDFGSRFPGIAFIDSLYVPEKGNSFHFMSLVYPISYEGALEVAFVNYFSKLQD
ncbi:MAG: hypothetical protein KC516_04725 [Nanoarchaeota archaeon]|nr:hypothetical protein [Nanoarchaeota archaeon]